MAKRSGTDTELDGAAPPDDPGRSSSWSVDRILTAFAAFLVPAGAVAIGLAWYGAARTPFVFEQIPYMISGGLLGLGLLTAGGLLYLGTWIARIAEHQSDEARQLREVLTGLREDLRGADVASAASAGTASATSAGAASAFVATPTGSMFHRRECAIVADRSDLQAVNGEASDLQPCKMCDPLEPRTAGV